MQKTMKIRILIAFGVALFPYMGHAQEDDMYFIPKKKTVQHEKVEEPSPVYFVPKEQRQPERTVVRDVDEYNRRYGYSAYGAVKNDTLYLDPDSYDGSETEEAVEEDGNWVNGFSGTDEDYTYAKRLLRFRSPSLGIPVSSPLYWDLCYGPDAIYWNVYDDGAYAYVFPSYWNYHYYWGRPYFSWTYGYGSWSWGFGWGWPHYHGWHSPFYDPWYGGWHHHHPHWGWRPGWTTVSRSHSSRREGAWFAPRGHQPAAPSGRRPTVPSTGTRPVGSGNRGTRITPGRSSGSSVNTRPNTVNRRNRVTQPSRNVTVPSRRTQPSATRRQPAERTSQPVSPQRRNTESSLGSGSRHSGFSSPGGGFGGGSRSSGGATRSGGGSRGGRR